VLTCFQFDDATSTTQARYANVTTAGSAVWDRKHFLLISKKSRLTQLYLSRCAATFGVRTNHKPLGQSTRFHYADERRGTREKSRDTTSGHFRRRRNARQLLKPARICVCNARGWTTAKRPVNTRVGKQSNIIVWLAIDPARSEHGRA